MQLLQTIKPVEGINVDVAPEYLKPSEVRYALNLERVINNSDGVATVVGKNAQISTPTPGNVLLDYNQPPGVNTVIGRHYAKRTNEIYVFVHNSYLNHHIYRINGKTNTIQMVLMDKLLNFQIAPRHQIRFRAHLFFNEQKVTNGLHRKYLVWTEGYNWQGFLDVETSITTNGFRVPYFYTADRTQLWQLAVRPPLECVYGDFATNNTPELTNRIKDKLWLFRYKYIYTDGRPSAWSPVSPGFINLQACAGESLYDPRCINLRINAGGPGVEKILLAYGNCLGSFTDDQNPQYYQTVIINKYEDCLGSTALFYERRINPNFNYDAATNTFLYNFCNEGTCIPVSRAETDLNFIPVPITSYALMPVEDKLALLNNEWGDDPLDCRVMSQLSFTPQQIVTTHQNQETVTVRVAIVIHQMFRGNNVPIFTYEDTGSNKPEETEGRKKFFGGLSKNQGTANPFDDPGPYDQFFNDTSKDAGFIVYVEGSDAFGVTKQYRTNGVDDGEPFIEDNFQSTSHRKDIAHALEANDYYYMQVAEIKVVKGTRGFLRVASHLAMLTDDFRNTSTNIWGVLYDRAQYRSNYRLGQDKANVTQQEIFFDTCGMTGSVLDMTGTPFVVCDLTAPYARIGTNHLAATSFTGYAKDTDGKPVAGAKVTPFGFTDSVHYSPVTDWNGYYFSTSNFEDIHIGNFSSGIDLFIEGPAPGGGCQQRIGGSHTMTGASRPNQNFRTQIIVGDTDYETNYLQPVRIRVLNSQNIPLAGVTIAASGNKAAITNMQGYAAFNIRRDMVRAVPFHQQVKFVLMPKSGCVLVAPGNCMPMLDQFLPYVCFRDAPVVDLDSITSVDQVAGEAGYHPGGVYPIAIKLIDAAGRETFAEKAGSVAIPEMQATGQFGLFQINWQINGLMNLPPDKKKMSILIGRNEAFEDYVSWVADDVSFVDSSGITATPTNADKILISIQSLYDNAAFYGFGTNVRYVFTPGDRVQILTDKDGKLYPRVFDFLVESGFNNRDEELEENEKRYSTLVIPFDKDLVNFGAGSLIKIYKPKVCAPQELFFETCNLIDIVNGEPVVKDGVINGFDTYHLRRSIRYDDMTHSFSFPFLHHSPSDFWGDHCYPRGRVSTTNPYTRRIRYERNWKLSGSFLDNGLFNGLGWYDDKLQKNFSGEQRGAIVAAVSIEKLFMCICEFDNFVAQTADEFVKVDSRTGQLVALAGDQIVSDAESKIVGNFGCQYDDVGSVEAGDGWVYWVDTFNKAPVLNDWQVAKDVSAGRMQGYFIPKLTMIYKNNLGVPNENKIRIVSGFDSVSRNILTTFFEPTGGFVHSRHEFVNYKNETIAYSTIDNTFPTAYGFTPENYAGYDNSILGNLFITFKNGKPWLHRVLSGTKFNTFYGQGSDQVFEPVINERPDKVKIMVAMQQLTEQPYYLDRIRTSNGHESILPVSWVRKFTEGKYDAEFLMANNRRGGLFNGPVLRGHWIQLRFVRDNLVDNIIDRIDANKQGKYSQLDRLMVKCTVSEQSAYHS